MIDPILSGRFEIWHCPSVSVSPWFRFLCFSPDRVSMNLSAMLTGAKRSYRGHPHQTGRKKGAGQKTSKPLSFVSLFSISLIFCFILSAFSCHLFAISRVSIDTQPPD